MKKRSIHISTYLLLLLFTAPGFIAVRAQEKKYSPEVENKIAQVEKDLGLWVQIEGSPGFTLQDRMKFYNANGVSIAVINNYALEWAKGYGWANNADKNPVSTATLFQAGSISKSLNGVGVLTLVQSKKLSLQNDINDYLTTWKFPYDSVSKGKKITLANLLSHTAGLTIHGFPGYENGVVIPTLAQILDGKKPANTAAVRSAFEPSLKYRYSGGGTTISQLVIQDITGQAYHEFMWATVLKPLSMTNSFYTQPPPKDKQKMLAAAYYNDGKPVKGKYHLYPEQAAAGLWTNPTDLAKYIIETQLSLMGKSTKVLSQQMTQLRLTPYIDSAAALGVFIVKKGASKYFSHGGVDEGFVSQYFGSMESGNGVVVMANTYNTALLHEIVNSVAKVYEWKDFYKPQLKKVITIETEITDAYVGKYLLKKDTFAITKNNNELILNFRNKSKLYFTSPTDFFMIESPGSEQSFLKDSQNKVTGILIKQGNQQHKAIKIE